MWGVEPICRVLQFAPSTYYAAMSRPVSAREVSDRELMVEILRVFEANFEVYGAEKIWRQLGREGIEVGRDRVARLMRRLGIAGVRRGKPRRTTIGAGEDRPDDLVGRDFTAAAPNRLWVADLTYVRISTGFVYVAFIIDAFSRVIVGWAVSTSLTRRAGPRRPGDRGVGPQGRRPGGSGASFRPGGAIHRYPLQPAPHRHRGGPLGRLQGRLVRQGDGFILHSFAMVGWKRVWSGWSPSF